MFWQFIRYNGEVWEAPGQMNLSEALDQFKADTGATDWDIKQINNLH